MPRGKTTTIELTVEIPETKDTADKIKSLADRARKVGKLVSLKSLEYDMKALQQTFMADLQNVIMSAPYGRRVDLFESFQGLCAAREQIERAQLFEGIMDMIESCSTFPAMKVTDHVASRIRQKTE
jgi:hypothetical protein